MGKLAMDCDACLVNAGEATTSFGSEWPSAVPSLGPAPGPGAILPPGLGRLHCCAGGALQLEGVAV